MSKVSRREMLVGAAALGVAASAAAQTFGNPDRPLEGRVNDGRSRASVLAKIRDG
jgi:hypothetical protein